MRRLISSVVAVALCAVGAAATSPGATAAAPASVSLVGHGWGHGRGMGQYGAYGYALAGWSSPQILGQYYGGTSAGQVDPNQQVSVRLTALDGAPTAAQGVVAYAGATQVASGTVTVTHTGTTLSVSGTQGSATGQSDITLVAQGSAPVQLMLPGSGWRSYKGTVVVKAVVGQTWNVLALDDYVGGVVPAESPASWGIQGAAALQAQAVAARSYAVARLAAVGNPICDTTACQVYAGDQDVAGTPTNSAYTPLTDQAVAATAGQVRICTTSSCGTPGSVALTEFSSSTGGWTAGGAFSAAVDTGDATASNPNHTWQATLPAGSLSAAWPSIGTFQAVTVTGRNGLGDLGGRVTQVVVSGSAGHVTMTGDAFAAALGLKSDWFAATTTGQPSGGLDGYWIVAGTGAVYAYGAAANLGSPAGSHLNAPVIGMAPTQSGGGYWLVAADGGIFSYGDAHFYGSTGSLRLNAPVISMAPTASGSGYWLFARDGGVFSFGDARFYGSTGSLRLNKPIVGMAATPSGRGYWLVAADGGIFSFGDAAYYGSMGATPLNRPVVGMVPTASGRGYTLVAADGGVFTFGDARYVGSLPGSGVHDTAVAVTPTADGGGYLVLGAGGSVYPFGDAPYFGDQYTVPGWSGTVLDIFGHRG